MSVYGEYDPTPYDEERDRARLIEHAEEMGEIGHARYEGQVDWDRLLVQVEGDLNLDLGSSMEAPVIRLYQRTYRKAYREANE